MKKQFFLIGFILTLMVEILTLIIYAVHTSNLSQDVVAVNEVVQSVTQDFYSIDEHKNSTTLNYVVVDNGGNIIYKTKSGLSESINMAIMNRDTILDVAIDNSVVGKVIIYNDEAQIMQTQKEVATIILSVAIAIQCAICVGYAVCIHFKIIKPFNKLKGFAERIAGGNLDIPLEMDRHNLFGAFTESFDIMRSELKKARLAEAEAQQSKKELVAKLSHDIKTPVSSIKAVAEVGLAVSQNEKDRSNYTQIVGKVDQINNLVTNLFTATLEELQQLSVTPSNVESGIVKSILENADYLHRATVPDFPDCLVIADSLRLQQVFDNIFANSYKYSNTKIEVTVERTDKNFKIAIEDFGGGVKTEELATLKEKFKRGSNATNIEGAGLGLYISDYFMKEMYGELIVENGTHGLKITAKLCLSGRI